MDVILKRTYFSLGLLAAGVIAFELVLIQIFSITQWYNFAYMVISVAMLGFGVAGTFLSLFEKWFLERYHSLFPSLLFLCGISMTLVVGISNQPSIRFDTYLIFTDIRQLGRLILTYLLFFIPFFLAALAIGLTFVRYVREIGTLYFADLLGSGLGALLGLLLMWLFFPWEIPGLVALLPVLAGVFSLKKSTGKTIKLIALIAIAVAVVSILNPPRLQLSEFKGISKTLLLPEAKVEFENTSPYGLVQVVSSPSLRYAPGISLNYQGSVPVRKAIFNNGDWVGAVVPPSDSDSTNIIDHTTGALPYYLRSFESVLVLNAGTGEQAAYALSKGAARVGLQEAHPAIFFLLRSALAGETDSMLFHDGLSAYNLEARTLLYRDTNEYDLIVLPTVSSFGGTSGVNALQEQYVMTKEAFREMWRKLKPNGMISIGSWIDYPVRNPIKLLATLVETLEEEGIDDFKEHLVVIRSWGTITCLLKKSSFSAEETGRIRQFCHEMHFDPVVLSGLKPGERQQYNQFQDSLFFSYVDAVLSEERESFYNSYDFNIRPATDDRPYFSQFLRWKSLLILSETFGHHGVPFLEIGYLIVVLTFFQILLIAMIMIILPLFHIGKRTTGIWRILFYFGGIGLGYMFVEIVLIQRFILYFGNPIYAAAAVISCLLISSGIGSYYSSRIIKSGSGIWIPPAIIILLLVIIAAILNPILLATIDWPVWTKQIILMLVILPLGFIMGIPFPAGIAHVAKKGVGTIPWAWGINGYFSVISTALATIIAVEFGFWWVIMCAALGYLLPVLSSLKTH